MTSQKPRTVSPEEFTRREEGNHFKSNFKSWIRVMALLTVFFFLSQQCVFARTSGHKAESSGLFEDPSWGDVALSAGIMVVSSYVGGGGTWSGFAQGAMTGAIANAGTRIAANNLGMNAGTAQVFGSAVGGAFGGWNVGGNSSAFAKGALQGGLIGAGQVVMQDVVLDSGLFDHNRSLGLQVGNLLGATAGYMAYNAAGSSFGFNDTNGKALSGADGWYGLKDAKFQNYAIKQGVSLGVEYAASKGLFGSTFKDNTAYSRLIGDSLGAVSAGSITGTGADGVKPFSFKTAFAEGLGNGLVAVGLESMGGKYDSTTGKNKLGMTQIQMASVEALGGITLNSYAQSSGWVGGGLKDASFSQDFMNNVKGLGTNLMTWGGTANGQDTWTRTLYLVKVNDAFGVSNFKANVDYLKGNQSWEQFKDNGGLSKALPGLDAAGLKYVFVNYVAQTTQAYAVNQLANVASPVTNTIAGPLAGLIYDPAGGSLINNSLTQGAAKWVKENLVTPQSAQSTPDASKNAATSAAQDTGKSKWDSFKSLFYDKDGGSLFKNRLTDWVGDKLSSEPSKEQIPIIKTLPVQKEMELNLSKDKQSLTDAKLNITKIEKIEPTKDQTLKDDPTKLSITKTEPEKVKGEDYPSLAVQAKQATLGNLLGWLPVVGKYLEMTDDQRQAYAEYNNEKPGDNTVPYAYRAYGSDNHGETLTGNTNFRIGLAAGTLGLIPPNERQFEQMKQEHGATGNPDNWFMRQWFSQGTISGWVAEKLGFGGESSGSQATAPAAQPQAKIVAPVTKTDGTNVTPKAVAANQPVLTSPSSRTIAYDMNNPDPRANPTVTNANGQPVNETEQEALTRGLSGQGGVTVSFKKDMPASLGGGIEWLGKKLGFFGGNSDSAVETKPASAAPIANDASKSLINTNTENRATQDKIGPAMEPAKPPAMVPVSAPSASKDNAINPETKGEYTMYYDKMDRNRQHPLVVETPTGETVTGKSNSDIYKAAQEQGVPIKVKVVESPTESLADKGVDGFGRGFRWVVEKIGGHDPAPDNVPVVIKPVSAPVVDSPSTNKAPVVVAPVAPSNAPAIAPSANDKLPLPTIIKPVAPPQPLASNDNATNKPAAIVAVVKDIPAPAAKQEAVLPDLPSAAAATQAAYSSYTNEAAKAQAAYSAYTNQAAKASAAYSSYTNNAATTQNIYSSLTNQAAQVKQSIDYINNQQQRR